MNGGNSAGVGWSNHGYIEGAFQILLYPALTRCMHMLSVLLVLRFYGQIRHWYLDPSSSAIIGSDKRHHLIDVP